MFDRTSFDDDVTFDGGREKNAVVATLMQLQMSSVQQNMENDRGEFSQSPPRSNLFET